MFGLGLSVPQVAVRWRGAAGAPPAANALLGEDAAELMLEDGATTIDLEN